MVKPNQHGRTELLLLLALLVVVVGGMALIGAVNGW